MGVKSKTKFVILKGPEVRQHFRPGVHPPAFEERLTPYGMASSIRGFLFNADNLRLFSEGERGGLRSLFIG
jgi:hypothetical protein